MTTDFRALCAELLDFVDRLTKHYYEPAKLAVRARAALAEPQPPADDEVAELVALIRQISLAWEPDACLLGNMTAGQLTRAADLLERLAQDHVQGATKMVEPTDEELLCFDDLRDAWNAQADPMNSWDELGTDEIVWWAQQQALARWGRPAPQPVPVPVSDQAVMAITESLGMIAMEFASKALKRNAQEAERQMIRDARQIILEWIPAHALPLPATPHGA